MRAWCVVGKGGGGGGGNARRVLAGFVGCLASGSGSERWDITINL